MGLVGGRAGTVFISPALIDMATGRAPAAAAHWLAALAGRLAGARRVGWALSVRRLDSAADGDGGEVSKQLSSFI